MVESLSLCKRGRGSVDKEEEEGFKACGPPGKNGKGNKCLSASDVRRQGIQCSRVWLIVNVTTNANESVSAAGVGSEQPVVVEPRE